MAGLMIAGLRNVWSAVWDEAHGPSYMPDLGVILPDIYGEIWVLKTDMTGLYPFE